MDLQLAGRRFLITGGSAGLGLALGDTLAAEGADVAICGRDRDRLEQAAEQIGRHGTHVLPIEADVRDLDSLRSMFSQIEQQWGVLHGLVNNAGFHTGGKFLDIDDETWAIDFDLKLRAIARTVRLAHPLMATADGAAVLNVLSIFARFQPAHSMPSSVFRAGGLALTKGMAKELAKDGIRVNAALIGFVHSDQWVRAASTTEQDVEGWEAGRAEQLGVPLGRIGRSEEFADVGAFLLSPRCSYITGTAINVDGGLSDVP